MTPIEEVRLNVGDNSPDYEVLPDATYTWLLTKYNDNVNRASIDAARYILFELTKAPTRERAGQVEVWNEWANAYRKALELFLKDPNFSISIAMPYAGGISKEDMHANDANTDNNRPAFYQGFSRDRHSYDSVEGLDLYGFD